MSTQELQAELALEAEAKASKRTSLAQMLERRSNEEDDSPKRCLRCGVLVPVKVKKRPRQVRTEEVVRRIELQKDLTAALVAHGARTAQRVAWSEDPHPGPLPKGEGVALIRSRT